MDFEPKHFPALEVKSQTKYYIDCPVCENKHAFQVDHLLRGVSDVHGGTCDTCETYFRFTFENGRINLVTALPPSLPVLVLLKYAGNTLNENLFFVVNTTVYLDQPGVRDREAEFDRLRYRIEEHTCPTNLIPVECLIHNGNDDDHGVVELVDYATIGDLCARYNVTQEQLLDSNNCYYQHYFQKHIGMEIDDSCVFENAVIEGDSVDRTAADFKQLLGKDYTIAIRRPESLDPAIRRTMESWLNLCGTSDPSLGASHDAVNLGQFIDQLIAEGYPVDKAKFTGEQLGNWFIWPKSLGSTETKDNVHELSIEFTTVYQPPIANEEDGVGEENH